MVQNLSIVFTGEGALEIRRGRVPELKENQILVETTKSLISTGTECICYNRWFEPGSHWDRWVQYPFSPGYSDVGIVRAAGSQVRHFAVGQRVVSTRPHTRFWLAEDLPAGSSVLVVPEGVSDEAAVWFTLGLIAQVGVRAAEHRLGDDVVVIGCGALGQLVIQYVRLMGARTVVAVDLAPIRLEAAQAHGATHTIALPVQECREAVAAATGGRMASVVYDVTGHAAVLAHALPVVRDFGALVVLGDTGSPSEQRLTPDVITRGLRIVGAHGTHPPAQSSRHLPWDRAAITALFFEYVARGDMRVDDLITHRHSPLDAKQVYDQLTADRSRVLGVVFDWTRVEGG